MFGFVKSRELANQFIAVIFDDLPRLEILMINFMYKIDKRGEIIYKDRPLIGQISNGACF